MDIKELKAATKDLRPRERDVIFKYIENGNNALKAYGEVYNSSSPEVASAASTRFMKRKEIQEALSRVQDAQIEKAVKSIAISKDTQTIKAEKIYLMTHENPDTANTALKALDQQNKLHGLYADQSASGSTEFNSMIVNLIKTVNVQSEATSSESEVVIEAEVVGNS